MHVAYLSPEYPHPKVTKNAGIGTSIFNLAKALVQKGEKVSVLVYGQGEDDHFTDQGIEVHFIKKRTYPFLGWYRYRKYLQDKVNQLIESQKVDIVEAPDWTGITAFMKLKAPLVLRLHGSDAYFCALEGRKQKRKNRFFETQAFKTADALSSPSAFTLERTRSLFPFVKEKKASTIRCGLFLEDFKPFSGPSTKGQVLYLGTLVRKKGALELADIFNELITLIPEAKLRIVGKDAADALTGVASTWDLVKNRLSEEAYNATAYHGKVPYEQVKQVIAQAQVCIFPTKAETFGMVTIEAMALGKPVVNSHYGWAQAIIEDGMDGYLADPNDAYHFAKIIATLINDQSLCDELGESARKKVVSHFNIHEIVEEHIKFFKAILS